MEGLEGRVDSTRDLSDDITDSLKSKVWKGLG